MQLVTHQKYTQESLQPKKALLISVYKNSADAQMCAEHLLELEQLAETYGLIPAQKEACFIRKYDASTFITSGKLEELVLIATKLDVDLVIFDDEISPGQQRNLEKAFDRPVVDRTEVILAVFAQRAQTKEAQLQIELAQTKYQIPRLKRLWTHLSRQGGTAGGGGGGGAGGGGHLKGEGEKQIEIDRRILRKQIERLQDEIDEVRAVRETQRASRVKAGIPVFAIIGYTNAGKSTLLNALTDANVFVENKLFATLDTTTRKFSLENNEEVLLIDTVGFIRKLPHLLVAAFKSTLEESLFADILLHVIDVSHHMAEEQAQATMEVLKELGAENQPIITVFNKTETCKDLTMLSRLKLQYPKHVSISALHKRGFEDLQEKMTVELQKRRKKVSLRIPQSEYAVVSEIIRFSHVVSQDYEENDILMEVELPLSLANKYQRYIVQ